MKKMVIALAIAAIAATQAAAVQGPTPSPNPTGRLPQTEHGTIVFYDQLAYDGREYEIDDSTRIFHWDWNIKSIGIHPGDRWQICARPRFLDCIILDRSVPDANMVGIVASIGSVREAPAETTAPTPPSGG